MRIRRGSRRFEESGWGGGCGAVRVVSEGSHSRCWIMDVGMDYVIHALQDVTFVEKGVLTSGALRCRSRPSGWNLSPHHWMRRTWLRC